MMMKAGIIAGLLLGLGLAGLRADPRAPLTPAERTNGAETLAAIDLVQLQVTAASIRIVDKLGKQVVTGTWVGSDGYLLTKASEVPHLEECEAQWGNGTVRKARLREVRRESSIDLVLAQAVGVKDVLAAKFEPATDLTYAQWLAAVAEGAKEVRIGVLSAQRRRIEGFGAAIGVRMDDKNPGMGKKGVRILGVAEDSPAAVAGLRSDDILLELAGEPIVQYRRVHEIVSKRQPGEEIEVRYLRSNQEAKVRVRLASRTKVLANWDGEDFANGGVSIRTDNFPQVLQHDLPLLPTDMGGLLMDLEGHAVGLNIARVDRVTTFALPSEVFWPAVQKWIATDRHPPKALPGE